jgi:hypothetical protein
MAAAILLRVSNRVYVNAETKAQAVLNIIRGCSMKRFSLCFTLIGAGLAMVASGTAQDKMADKKMDTTVTGCLAQGSGGSDYTIRDSSGKSYNLTGTKVNLKPHVGHEVSITGKPGDTDHGATGGGSLEVDSLKMVSTTCKS